MVVVSSITAEIAGEEPVMPDRTGSEKIMGTGEFSSSPVRGETRHQIGLHHRVDTCSLAAALAAEWWWSRKKNLANEREPQGESISGGAFQQAGAPELVKRARTPIN
jgi:hypothetical protein